MSAEKAARPGSSPCNDAGRSSSGAIGEEAVAAGVEQVTVVRCGGDLPREYDQEIIREAPVTLFVNGRQVVTLMTVPYDLPALAVGFLFSEGWIRDRSTIQDVRVDRASGVVRVELSEEPTITGDLIEKRMIGSSCGKATSFANVLDALLCRPVHSAYRVAPGRIACWMRELLRGSPLYQRTRGAHNVALFGSEGRIVAAEDLGRHNAVDRVLGRTLLDRIATDSTVLLTTGRLSSEMVTKAARMGAPIVASRSSTTSLAVSLGRQLSVTIVGQVSGERMVVYSCPERLLQAPTSPETG